MQAQTAAGGSDGRIELRVRDLRQLFESMDPTPFPGKDLDPNAARFIVAWARECSPDAPLRLLIHVEKPGTNDAALIAPAVAAYFQAEADASRLAFRRLIATGRQSLLIGLGFLTACLWTADWLGGIAALPPILAVLRESLLIGGWVALWRPLEIFLYDWWPLRADRRLYERLASAAVEIAAPAAGPGPLRPGSGP
jgi:hypothetical protein